MALAHDLDVILDRSECRRKSDSIDGELGSGSGGISEGEGDEESEDGGGGSGGAIGCCGGRDNVSGRNVRVTGIVVAQDKDFS